jgi:hypothetical protein
MSVTFVKWNFETHVWSGMISVFLSSVTNGVRVIAGGEDFGA